MKKNKERIVVMLIWLPWVWKSTYVNELKNNRYWDKNVSVVSSDEIRCKLYDETKFDYKKEPEMMYDEVFKRYDKKYIDLLDDKNVDIIILDALNTNKKLRKFYINEAKQRNIQIHSFELYKNIAENIEWLNERNKDRAESSFNYPFMQINRNIYEKQLKLSIFPNKNEWFDRYSKNIFYNTENKKQFLLNIENFLNNVNSVTELKNNFDELFKSEYLKDMIWFKQESQYHMEDLDIHLKMIMESIMIDYEKWMFDKKVKDFLLMTTIFHDIWKLYTRLHKYENFLFNWKKQDKNDPTIFYNKDWSVRKEENYMDYQFIWHEWVSAYIFENEYLDNLIEYWFLSEKEAYIMLSIINEHLDFHVLNYSRDWKNVKKLEKFKLIWLNYHFEERKLIKNNELDIKVIENVETIFDEFINLWLLFSKYDNSGRILR